jgi:hypothetical protein
MPVNTEFVNQTSIQLLNELIKREGVENAMKLINEYGTHPTPPPPSETQTESEDEGTDDEYDDDTGELRTVTFEDGKKRDTDELGNVFSLETGNHRGRYYVIDGVYKFLPKAVKISYPQDDYDEDAQTGSGKSVKFYDGETREVDKFGKVFVNGRRVGRSYKWIVEGRQVYMFVPWILY